MIASGDIPRVLERYRGEGERGYSDLHDHVLALHRAGLLIVVGIPRGTFMMVEPSFI